MNEIILEFSAFAIALFCLVDCIKNRPGLYARFSKGLDAKLSDQHFSYICLMVMLLISAATSVVEVSMEIVTSLRKAAVLDAINLIYFIFHTALSALFCLYMINMTDTGKRFGKKSMAVFLMPLAIIEAIILSNPFTKLIYYIDDTPAYVRGNGIWLVYLFASGYILAGAVFLFFNISRIPKLNRTATLVLVSISTLGVVLQAIFMIPVELFFEAIAFFGFLLLLEDEKYREKTGRYAHMNMKFTIIIILIFLTVVALNVNIILSSGTGLTDDMGQMQIETLKGEMQQEISESESDLLRYSMSLEQLLSDNKDITEIEEYIALQKEQYGESTGGNCFSVYAANKDWTIIPGFDFGDDYKATERVWYTGARDNPGRIYISEPYIDANTQSLCYTLSYLLSDSVTVAAMDYTLDKVQGIVARMSGASDQFAVIVTDEGTIVGCSDDKLQGELLSEVLPEYTDIFERVKASTEHRSFGATVNSVRKIVFSGETTNGWRMIVAADRSVFYSQIYSQMGMLIAIDLLMAMVIIVFFMVSVINQRKAEKSLESTEDFIASLAGDLRDPLNNIMRISDMYESSGEASNDAIRSIHESGSYLREKMDNLFSYSKLAQLEEVKAAAKKERTSETSISSKHMRNRIIAILIAALVTGLVLCLVMGYRWGQTRIGREAENYDRQIAIWMQQKESILHMFTDVISVTPQVMDNYDEAVAWLDGIVSDHGEINFAYLGNPGNKDHPITMNNGWIPGPDFVLEKRQWYIDAVNSSQGSSISAPYIDAQTGLYCITFSECVYNADRKLMGVFGIDCLMDKLIDVLAGSYTSDSYAFLVDQNGIIINHPNKDYEMSADNEVSIENTVYADAYYDVGTKWIRDYDGRLVVCHAAKSSLSGFSVIYVRSWWSIYGMILLTTMLFLVLIVLSIVTVVRMIRRFIVWQDNSNAKLQEAVDSAVSAEKAKSRFLAQMSHEIRTPINTVLGMNEMIMQESDDGSIKEYAANISMAGKNLLGLINSILDFSKIEEGRMEIIPVRYDTASLVEVVVNSIAKRAKDKQLDFNVHVDKDLPSVMYGDDMRISQIVSNLLTNAVKYTNKGSIDLYIDAGPVKDDSILVSVRVKDTGIGIKEEDIGRLTESFTRLEERRNRNIEGTGLGMAIVNGLLEMMNSKLEIKSVYGEGSEFSFVLEQTIVDATPLGDYSKHARRLSEKKRDQIRISAPEASILVVDDNKMNLTVMRSLLRLCTIVPDLAGSGAEALAKLKDKRYDIVMLDHMMPEMDGIETLNAAKERSLIPDDCIVIALTANAVVGAREEYIREGFDDYLSKPVEIKSLIELLVKYLPEEKVTIQKDTKEKA